MKDIESNYFTHDAILYASVLRILKECVHSVIVVLKIISTVMVIADRSGI